MKYWKTKEGKILKIVDMETSHIENCIKMLEKLLESRPDEQVYMGDSEVAEDWVEQENRANEQMAEKINEAISSFENELRYRKMGKPIGEDFPLPVIQPWEVKGFRDLED